MTDAPVTVSAFAPADADARRPRRWRFALLAVFAFAFAAVFFRTPSPLSALADSDGGQQLAGAQQIAFGEHPFVDFRSNYGPLAFYVTFIDQWLSGWRIGGELLWCTIAYAAGYTLLFVAARWMTANRVLPFAVVLLAVLQLPRFYKYYILLGPAMTLAACLWYLGRPSLWRMLLVAAGAVVTGLYRPDMGAYVTVSSFIAVALARDDWNGRLRGCVALALLMMLVCSPWLIFLITRHGLLAYVVDSTIGSATQAKGLALPFPFPRARLAWNAPYNLQAYTFLLWWSLPLIAGLILLAGWSRIELTLRRRAVVVVAMSALCLIQSAHRSDYNHLIQALAPSYVLAAFVVSQLMESFAQLTIIRAGVAVMALMLAGLSVFTGAATGSLGAGTIAVFSHYARFHFRDRAEFVVRSGRRDPANTFVRLTQFIAANTKPGERILAIPFLPTLYYFSGRPFAGRQMLIAPGYFSQEKDQRRMIQAMREQGNPMVIESTEGGGFDGIASRQPRSFAGLFYEYLDAAYQPVAGEQLPKGYAAWRAKESGH